MGRGPDHQRIYFPQPQQRDFLPHKSLPVAWAMYNRETPNIPNIVAVCIHKICVDKYGYIKHDDQIGKYTAHKGRIITENGGVFMDDAIDEVIKHYQGLHRQKIEPKEFDGQALLYPIEILVYRFSALGGN